MSSGQHSVYNIAFILRQMCAGAWACPRYALLPEMVLHEIRVHNFAKVADYFFMQIDDPD